jgi:hypothetical protein
VNERNERAKRGGGKKVTNRNRRKSCVCLRVVVVVVCEGCMNITVFISFDRSETLSVVHACRITGMLLLFGLGDRSKDLVSHSVFRVEAVAPVALAAVSWASGSSVDTLCMYLFHRFCGSALLARPYLTAYLHVPEPTEKSQYLAAIVPVVCVCFCVSGVMYIYIYTVHTSTLCCVDPEPR